MIALVPSEVDLDRLALDDAGEPRDELHLTLWFLGDAADLPEGTPAELVRAARSKAARGGLVAVHGRAFGAALWNPAGDEPCWVLNVGDLPADQRPAGTESLAAVRRAVGRLWAGGLLDLDVPAQHTPWSPHVCLAYSDDPDLLGPAAERVGPVVFDRLRLAFGGLVIDIPLDPPDADVAVEAYTAGWMAAYGAALSERSILGAAAAEQWAGQHGASNVAEVTHWLGHLDGTWAVIHDRREDVHRRNQRAVGRAVADLLAKVDAAAVARAALHVGERLDPERHATLIGKIADILAHLLDTPEWQALRDALAGAGMMATAEGAADALATLADGLGKGIEIEVAFADGLDALEADDFLGDADGWLGDIVNGVAHDLGQALASVVADEGSYEALVAAAEGVLGGQPPKSVQTVVDMATGRALTDGMLSVYRKVGAAEVDWLTAGDTRVCPTCAGHEDGNPHPLDSPPACPAHPWCRCVLQALDYPDPSPLVGPYLDDAQPAAAAAVPLADMTDDQLAALLADPEVAADADRLAEVMDELAARDEWDAGLDQADELTDEQLQEAVKAEEARYKRETREAKKAGLTEDEAAPVRKGATAQQQARDEWDLWMHQTMLDAEDATRGNLLSKAGKKAGATLYDLFTGSAERSIRYASEELISWWEANDTRRMTWTEWRAAATGHSGPAARRSRETWVKTLQRWEDTRGKGRR